MFCSREFRIELPSGNLNAGRGIWWEVPRPVLFVAGTPLRLVKVPTRHITSGREQIRALRSFQDQQKFRFLAPASSQPRPGAAVIDFVNEAWPKEIKSPIRSSEMSDG
jgi:hypothetical protein